MCLSKQSKQSSSSHRQSISGEIRDLLWRPGLLSSTRWRRAMGMIGTMWDPFMLATAGLGAASWSVPVQ